MRGQRRAQGRAQAVAASAARHSPPPQPAALQDKAGGAPAAFQHRQPAATQRQPAPGGAPQPQRHPAPALRRLSPLGGLLLRPPRRVLRAAERLRVQPGGRRGRRGHPGAARSSVGGGGLPRLHPHRPPARRAARAVHGHGPLAREDGDVRGRPHRRWLWPQERAGGARGRVHVTKPRPRLAPAAARRAVAATHAAAASAPAGRARLLMARAASRWDSGPRMVDWLSDVARIGSYALFEIFFYCKLVVFVTLFYGSIWITV